LSRDLALAALGLIVILAAGSADARARLFRSRLFAFSLAASLSTLIVLAETALWDHALEALAFPIFLCAALALDCVRTVARGSPARLVERLAVGVVGCGFLLVALWPRPSIEYVKAWAAPPTMIVSDALQRAAEPTGARNSDVSYMHLGTNDDEAQGAFLPASFRLACPRFHQYPFTPWRALRQTILCIQRERPQLIAVTPSFTTNSWTYSGRSPPPAWRQFVLAGKAYLRSHCAAFVTNEAVQVYRCRGRLRLDE
jgi:hypothetical protein